MVRGEEVRGEEVRGEEVRGEEVRGERCDHAYVVRGTRRRREGEGHVTSQVVR